MRDYITFNHATQGPVAINMKAVFAVYKAATGFTNIVSIGGNFLPVKESKEDVVSALEQQPVKEKIANVRKQRISKRYNDSLPFNNAKQK